MITLAGGFQPKNRLLRGLGREDAARLAPHLMPADLPQGKVLFDAGEQLTHVYFPEAGVVSVVGVFTDGTVSEMATVGREGVLAAGALLDGIRAIGRHMVQVPGAALTLDVVRLRGAMRESGTLRLLLTSYVQAFLAQALQSVACNGVHVAEQRAARWLLMAHDRSEGDAFALTQEFLAEMLGVQRPTVSLIARGLQRLGLIRYSRGSITVLDREGLEEASCECYRIVRQHYDELLPPAGA